MIQPGVLLSLLVMLAIFAGFTLRNSRDGAGRESRDTQFELLQERVRLLEEENLRLRDRAEELQRAGAVEDPEAVIRRDLEELVGEMRELPWKRPVHYKIVTRDGVGDLIRESLRGRPSEALTMRNGLLAMEAMGWIDPGATWREAVGALFTGTAAAWFDVSTSVMHVARETAMENAPERALFVNEVTTALIDQQIGLDSFTTPVVDELWRDSDQALARQALAAGDAALMTIRYNAEYGSAMVTFDRELTEYGAKVALLGFAPEDGAADSGGPPAALREIFAFPHTAGADFCGALMEGRSFLDLNAAYNRPPQSTTEILHPELYQLGDFAPRRFDWREEDYGVKGRGILRSDVAGEFGIRLLLKRFLEDEDAAWRAADGWRGDRFIVYAAPEAVDGADTDPGDLSVLWRTEWATPSEAAEFREAFAQALAARYSLKEPLEDSYDGDRFLSLKTVGGGTGVVFVDADSGKRREEIGNLVP